MDGGSYTCQAVGENKANTIYPKRHYNAIVGWLVTGFNTHQVTAKFGKRELAPSRAQEGTTHAAGRQTGRNQDVMERQQDGNRTSLELKL